MRRIVCVALFTVILVTALVVCWRYYKKDAKGKTLVRKCKELELGMTREEVEAIMGPPISVFEFENMGRQKQILNFASRPLAATMPECVLDKESGLIEEIVCDEGYRIKKE